jgi:hypothetical protein
MADVDPSLTTNEQLVHMATLAIGAFPDHVGNVKLTHVVKAAQARDDYLTKKSCRVMEAVYPPGLVEEAKCYHGSAGSYLAPEDLEIPDDRRPFEVKKFHRHKSQVFMRAELDSLVLTLTIAEKQSYVFLSC